MVDMRKLYYVPHASDPMYHPMQWRLGDY